VGAFRLVWPAPNMATFQVSGPPEDVARLKFLSDNFDLVKHVAEKMRAQKLSPADHVIVVVALAADNALGMAFMRQTFDPKFDPADKGPAYACNVSREELKSFLEPSAPASLSVTDADIPAGSHRMVILADNGVTKMDAAIKPS
jgi:hypothetical protein